VTNNIAFKIVNTQRAKSLQLCTYFRKKKIEVKQSSVSYPTQQPQMEKKKYLLKCIVKLFEIELFFFCYCFIAETALLLPAALSKNRHENDTSDIRRNLRLRYRDLYKHNRDNE
jgi:hypothetical protein